MSIAYQAYPKKGSGEYLICKPKGDDVFAYIDKNFEKAKQKAKETLLTIKCYWQIGDSQLMLHSQDGVFMHLIHLFLFMKLI